MSEKRREQNNDGSVMLGLALLTSLCVFGGTVAGHAFVGYLQRKQNEKVNKEFLQKLDEQVGKGKKDCCTPRLTGILRKVGRKVDRSLKLTKDEERIAQDILDPADMESGFASIGGLDDLKQEIWQLVVLPILKPKVFASTSSKLIQRPSGILLYGKPGCGKTLLAKAIAKESGAIFIPIGLSRLLNKYWGESEKVIAATFSLARKVAPSIVFFDEMDGVFAKFGSDSSNNSLYLDSITKCFLTELDGVSTKEKGSHVLVFGATNRPQRLDKAILRRFPRAFYIPLPNGEGREQILRVLLKGQAMDDSAQAFLPKLARDFTEGYSGSDLKELCRAAAMEPVREAYAEEAKCAVSEECCNQKDGPADMSNNSNKNEKIEDDTEKDVEKNSENGKIEEDTKKDEENDNLNGESDEYTEKNTVDEEEANIVEEEGASDKDETVRSLSERDFRVALEKVKQTGQVADDYGKSESAPSAELRNSLYA